MSNQLPSIESNELLHVIGGAGTGATSLPGAIGHYLTNNGGGSIGSQAGVLGEKAWNRVKYSAGITPNIAQYTHQLETIPGGADYIADIKKLRP